MRRTKYLLSMSQKPLLHITMAFLLCCFFNVGTLKGQSNSTTDLTDKVLKVKKKPILPNGKIKDVTVTDDRSKSIVLNFSFSDFKDGEYEYTASLLNKIGSPLKATAPIKGDIINGQFEEVIFNVSEKTKNSRSKTCAYFFQIKIKKKKGFLGLGEEWSYYLKKCFAGPPPPPPSTVRVKLTPYKSANSIRQ